MTDDAEETGTEAARILVLDDQLLVGMDVAMMLEDWGYEAVGPFGRLSQAMAHVESDPPDAAILDVDLGDGETSLPLAHRLSERGIPFLFLTGYESSRPFDCTEFASEAPHMRKPLQEKELRDMVDRIVADRSRA